ncbi:MAG TPA: DegV family protein [Anaerolineae bacterium]|nr:DegV family protein [Anaerolineae bacterium]
MINIVTDSTSDIPPDLARELHITVIPAHVIFGNESFDDGVTITREEFYRRLKISKALPTTSTPSAGEFAELYRRVGGEIVSIHVAARWSSLFSTAQLGASLVPEVPVTFFDSGKLAMGLGWQVILAARAAQQGQSVAEIMQVLQDAKRRVRLFAALDTLEYLRRSGRVNALVARFGQLLSIKPLIEVGDGEVWMIDRVRTKRAALDRIRSMTYDLGPLQSLAVLHTANLETALALADEFAMNIPKLREPIIVCEATTAVGTHVGPNGLGIAAIVAE